MGRILSTQSNPSPFVILNLFQDNEPPSRVILKQVQDDAILQVNGFMGHCGLRGICE
jgi:hypothetical protein